MAGPHRQGRLPSHVILMDRGWLHRAARPEGRRWGWMVSPLVQSSELSLRLGLRDVLLTAFKIRRKKKEYNQNEGIRMNLDWMIFVFLPSQP